MKEFLKKLSAPKFLTLAVHVLWIGLLSGLLLLCIFIWSVSINLFGLYGSMPAPETLENPKSELASEILSADMVSLGKYFRHNRTPVAYEDLSPNLVYALLATEDVRFYEHSGIDEVATGRVAFGLLTLNQKGGGSTLTQQLAKNLFKTRSALYEGTLSRVPGLRTLITKTKEWITAVKLEQCYTKKEIFTMYLNTVDFGSNAYGIKVAAKTFFDKEPADLLPQEAAVLVGLLKAPSYYNPFYNPENALVRRNTVLYQMRKYNYLTPEAYDSLSKQPIELTYKVDNHNTGPAPYFRKVMMNYLLKWCDDRGLDLWSDGLKIYTTIDSKIQQYAEEAMEKHMSELQKQFYKFWGTRNPWVDENLKEIPNFIERVAKRTETYRYLHGLYDGDSALIAKEMNRKKQMIIYTLGGEKDTLMSSYDSLRHYKKILQAGLLSIDPRTGHIKAWVGGINHKFFKFDHVKQGRRQPGSTFKPFVYATALDNGYSPCYEVQDIPVTFQYEQNGEYRTWTPKNSDNVYSGDLLTLRQAMAKSINSISAYLIKKLGPERVVEYARRMGITSPLEAVPALSLGVNDVTLYELVSAYGTFVNKGVHTEPFFINRIEDKDGNLLQSFSPVTHEAISEETAYLMVHMLKGGIEEAGGTSKALYRYKYQKDGKEYNVVTGNEIGGKTGTTSNYSDGWYIGITPNLVTGVWVGGDDRSIHFTSFEYGQGSRMALPIWGMMMSKVYGDTTLDYGKGRFERPSKPLSVELNCSKYEQKFKEVQDSLYYSAPAKPNVNNLLNF